MYMKKNQEAFQWTGIIKQLRKEYVNILMWSAMLNWIHRAENVNRNEEVEVELLKTIHSRKKSWRFFCIIYKHIQTKLVMIYLNVKIKILPASLHEKTSFQQ